MLRKSAIRLMIGLVLVIFPCPLLAAERPAWCTQLPRPEYRSLQRVAVSGSWFEVYRVAPETFAIYEPHQSEETISYLIVGNKKALLFDTGMGIGDLKAVTRELTQEPVVVLNSHTHNDHVGDNWQFQTIYSMDTPFSRANALGSTTDAQAEIQPGDICGALPPAFHPASYRTRPWKISSWIHDGSLIDLGGRTLQVIATPGHTPDAICLLDPANGLLFTGDTFYPGTIWLYRPETDLAAYGRSVHRLALLAPRVHLVLGAHNVPVANSAVLKQLPPAFNAVRSSKRQGTSAGPGKITYTAEGISFLVRDPFPQRAGGATGVTPRGPTD